MAEWSRPVFGTARHEAASEDQVLSVSKVASNSSGGVPGIGHFLPLRTVSFVAVRRDRAERIRPRSIESAGQHAAPPSWPPGVKRVLRQ